MSSSSLFLLKTLLLLCVFCAVLCEHQKRDVHHQIVLKQRVPRSHRKNHGHNHNRKHKRGHSHSGKNRGRGHKKGKKHRESYERDSYEDEGSFSRENSFEDLLHSHKGYKSSHQKYSSRPYHKLHQFEDSLLEPYKEESRLPFYNEWIPLNSDQILQHSQEVYRDKRKKKKESKGKKHLRKSLQPPPLEITTSYPFQFETSTVYPQLSLFSNAYSNYNLNKKIMESNQSPLIGTIEQPKMNYSPIASNSNFKNHKPSYEVLEINEEPTNVKPFIVKPAEIKQESSEESLESETVEKEEVKTTTTKRPSRNRGRFNNRGKAKP